jgi:flagellar motor switch protein FliM
MAEILSAHEIDAILTAINAGDTEPEDFRPARDTRKIKIYDFARPDKFSRNQIRTISILHETFARLTTTSLSSKLRSMVHVHVASVDQLTYEEFIRSIPTPTCLAIINPDPLKYNWLLEIDPSVTFSIMQLLLGGDGTEPKFQHELTDIEISLMEGVIVRMLCNMREAWTNILDLRPRLGDIDTNPQFCQIVHPCEMVILVTLEVKIGDTEGMINICMPYLSLEPIINKLDFQSWYNPTISSDIKKLISEKDLNKVSTEMRAILFKEETTLKKLEPLKIGDKIPFNLNYQLMIDNINIANFDIINNSNKIKINKINKIMETNFMEEKHNVKYDTGLDNIKIQLIGEIGRTLLPLKEVSAITEGTIIELNSISGEPVNIFANNILLARGEVVVIDENFGIRITEIVDKPNNQE